MILTLEPNTNGLDFVVGDLHGMVDLLDAGMAAINFDHEVDRMISVGDLVDRGTKNLESLQLLDNDWFYCVKGNHEQLMEAFLTGDPLGIWWHRNGGGWYLELDSLEKGEVNRLLDKVQNLPSCIVVNGPVKYYVLHAEIYYKEITDDTFYHQFDNVSQRDMGEGEAVLWGRDKFGTFYGRHIANLDKAKRVSAFYGHTENNDLSHIYSGHTTVRQPLTIAGQTNLDTGAFRANRDKWAGLTITEPATNKFWTTNFDGTREVQPIVL